MKIVLIHGFNVRDAGAGTIDTLAPYLEAAGHDIDKDGGDYGWHFLIKVRFGFLHYEAVQRITCAIAAADAAILHSNGANYFNQAAELLHGIWPEKKLRAVYISPALDEDVSFPPNVERATVLFTPHDKPVRIARILRGHPWGAMGAYGPNPCPAHVTALEYPSITGHSAWFSKPNREGTARICHEALTE